MVSIQTPEILEDTFDRIRQELHRIAEGASESDLAYRPDPAANSIAWLLWHLTRVMDDHVSEIAGTEQVWLASGWSERFGLPLPPSDMGYGHTAEQVGQVAATTELLIGYHDAVQEMATTCVAGLESEDLDRIIDRRWDPPVSVGVRLVSVIGDCLQHVGQAAYVLGLAERA